MHQFGRTFTDNMHAEQFLRTAFSTCLRVNR
jgi:hypothetical protein